MSKLLEVLTHVSAVFQAGGLIVVVVEVTRKAFLASLVPVIVDAILNEHQVIADIVAFVSHGDFPRSRLGEKQRGKVLASWVTRNYEQSLSSAFVTSRAQRTNLRRLHNLERAGALSLQVSWAAFVGRPC